MPTAFDFEITPDGQGAVFALNVPARRDRRQTIGSWEVEIRKDNSYICVRSPVSDLNKSLSKIVEEPADIAAQEFLDILAVEERTPLLVVEPRDNLLWRSGPHGLKFQLTTSITFSAQVGGLELTVTDAKGNAIPPPTYIPPQHHFAYRYFRYSQAAQNVFDGYRNMFLALESILDQIAPKQPNEGETDWLKRTLTTAIQNHRLDLSAFAKPGTSDPVEDFVAAHYSAVRCAVFHAKSSAGQTLRPGSLSKQSYVLHQLLNVQVLVETLLKSEFSVRLPQTGFYHSGFGHLLSLVGQQTCLLISISDCPTVEQVLAKEENIPETQPFPVRFIGLNGSLTDEWLFLSEISCNRLGFSKIASMRLATKLIDHILVGPIVDEMNRMLLKTDLDVDGVSRMVVKIRCVLRNQQSPRRGFSY